MNGYAPATEARQFFKFGLDSSFIAVGQQRAKELIANIERGKQLAKMPTDQTPTAEIAPSGYGSGLLVKADYLVPLLKTVAGIKIQTSRTDPVNLLSLVEELKKSVVMIKVY
jgi:hypothetical protein